MVAFQFTTTEPAAGSNPGSVSRPAMQTNNQSTNDILAVDHVTFNNDTGGLHKQVSYVNTSSPSKPTSPLSIAFTTPGTADPTTPQNFFINNSATFPLSAIKAFASFTSGADGPITPSNQYNVVSVTQTTLGSTIFWHCLITPGAIFGGSFPVDNCAVFLTYSNAPVFIGNVYQFTAANDLRINLNTSTPRPITINFVIVQI